MKARKAMALAMTAAMVGGLMTVPVMAEENAELLPGGGRRSFTVSHLPHLTHSSTQSR